MEDQEKPACESKETEKEDQFLRMGAGLDKMSIIISGLR